MFMTQHSIWNASYIFIQFKSISLMQHQGQSITLFLIIFLEFWILIHFISFFIIFNLHIQSYPLFKRIHRFFFQILIFENTLSTLNSIFEWDLNFSLNVIYKIKFKMREIQPCCRLSDLSTYHLPEVLSTNHFVGKS